MPTEIRGDEELIRKLKRIGNLNFLRPQIQAAVTHIAGKVSVYPNATAANRPNAQGRWYERGWGTRWQRKDGSIGGRQTSEDLGPSWKGKVISNTRGEIGNDASYAKYVQGGDTQAQALKDIGWKTTDQIVEEESEKVLRQIQQAVDRELAKG